MVFEIVAAIIKLSVQSPRRGVQSFAADLSPFFEYRNEIYAIRVVLARLSRYLLRSASILVMQRPFDLTQGSHPHTDRTAPAILRRLVRE